MMICIIYHVVPSLLATDAQLQIVKLVYAFPGNFICVSCENSDVFAYMNIFCQPYMYIVYLSKSHYIMIEFLHRHLQRVNKFGKLHSPYMYIGFVWVVFLNVFLKSYVHV